MLHGSSKGCFYCVWTDLWRYMGVHQREGAIGAVVALGCLIPCIYGLSGVFSGASVALARCKGGKAVRSVFLWGIVMDKVRDEALNSVFNALLWGGCLLPLFYAEKLG